MRVAVKVELSEPGRTLLLHADPEADLEKCLRDYIGTYNENPRPLVWTKPADEILEKVERARQALAAAAI